MNTEVKVEGLTELLARLHEAPELIDKAVGASIYQHAEFVMTESQRIVPVDTGTLKNSKMVSQPIKNGNVVEVELSYGGAASGYALKVHEDLNMRHHDGQQAKYLEQPLLENAPLLGETLPATVAENLQRLKK